jgi:hypothetical protein
MLPTHHGGGGGGAASDYGSFGNASPLNSILGGGSTSASVASSPDIESTRFYSGGGGGGGYQGQEHGSGSGPGSVLLFGLSANPPTGRGGHAGIVSFLQAQGQWDEIWVRFFFCFWLGFGGLGAVGVGRGFFFVPTASPQTYTHMYVCPYTRSPPPTHTLFGMVCCR